jgi:hypothetical protein
MTTLGELFLQAADDVVGQGMRREGRLQLMCHVLRRARRFRLADANAARAELGDNIPAQRGGQAEFRVKKVDFGEALKVMSRS